MYFTNRKLTSLIKSIKDLYVGGLTLFFKPNVSLFQINQGGKIPKELYLKNDKKINTLPDDMTLVNIKKGDKLYLKFTVTVPQSFLR